MAASPSAAEAASKAEPTEEAPQARTEDLLTIDPLKIELGYGLITMADPKQGGDLLTRIQIIRQQTATKMGFIVPVIRIVDNMRLKPNEYRVKLRESVIATYEVLPGHFLAMNPGLVEEEIDGYPTTEPAFGLQAMWVNRAFYAGLYIEMKRKKGGKESSEQKEWREYLISQGYKAVVCKGADEAIAAIKEYLA